MKLEGSASDKAFAVGVFLLLVVAFVGVWIGAAYVRAEAFNRATGSNVSVVDAMFTKLVVQAPAAK